MAKDRYRHIPFGATLSHMKDDERWTIDDDLVVTLATAPIRDKEIHGSMHPFFLSTYYCMNISFVD